MIPLPILNYLALLLLVIVKSGDASKSGSNASISLILTENDSSQIIPYNLKKISRVTGKTLPHEGIPNPNNTDALFDVAGTDLGIMWLMGNGKTGIFFGDTYGGNWKPNGINPDGPHWRSNVLAFSEDTNLEDGLTIKEMISDANGLAREIIPSEHIRDGSGSYTRIPTVVVRIGNTDYVHFMDVQKWLRPGEWKTNYSGLYRSIDNGINWTNCSQIRFDSISKFAQAAFAVEGRFVIMLGTPAGRFGSVYLARFQKKDILKRGNYEYWNDKKGWVQGNEDAATPIFNSYAGELSLIYNLQFKRWILTYLNEKKREIVLRDSPLINGTWSEEKTLVDLKEYPEAYGAFIHPSSISSDTLYFLMSQWKPYNVFLMKADLKLENRSNQISGG